MRRIVNVNVEDRGDDGLCVSSDELPGLILSGKDKTKILFAIEPAVKALLRAKGEDADDIRIDANCSHATIASPR